ncbi:MAG: diacylglyceryl transferase [Flavobacteriaceae bacterium TMED238]|nr:diacylglyceryl transferase [Flavobacteriales bacterium]RPG61226.1 MAG: diacylglyceryl transferase [Flavobacteriaceae bacterium TMED238]|tara:strand:+ start:955 stop:1251 length:297 start_codon:yes stop_codon:yes gene_type:complete
MFQYLKEKWNLKSNFQLVIILIVFAITGSSSLYISKPLMEFLSISNDSMNVISYWILRFIIVTLVYQLVLLVVAFLFGQFNWFWNFEKKMLKKMGLIK